MTLSGDDLVLVTGASSGIGEGTVRALRARDIAVVAVARRVDRLQALADETGCDVEVLDLRDRDGVAALGASRPFTALVNNAGLGRAMTSLVDGTADDIDRTIETNVSAVLHLTRAVLPSMIERGRGHLVNIGSTAGHYPLPVALYGSTKAAIHLLTTSLRLELQGTGVRVTEVVPGRVSTEFYDVAVDDPEQRAVSKETGITELTADDVAGAILYALDAPARVNVTRVELQPTEQTYGGYNFVRGPDS